MRITPILTAIVWLGAASFALAQTSASRPTPADGRYVAIGCLTKQGTGSAARYIITDRRGDKPTMYRLQGETALLERHVGHTVEVTGAMAANATRTLNIRSLVWISSSCHT